MIRPLRAIGASVAVALATVASPAHAELEWGEGGGSWSGYTPAALDGDLSLYLVRDEDEAKLLPDTRKGQFWTKVDHTKDKSVTPRHSMLLVSVDCAENTYAIRSATSYTAEGNVARSLYETFYAHRPAVPESAIGETVRYACTRDSALRRDLDEAATADDTRHGT